jgi:hypothetical protein
MNIHLAEELPIFERTRKHRTDWSGLINAAIGKNKKYNPNKKRRMCSDKRRFRSIEQANSFLSFIRYKEGTNFDPARVYPCPICDGFHATSHVAKEELAGVA